MNIKRALLAVGLLGLVGCFLPLTMGVTWFELRHFDPGWTVWIVMAAFAVPALVGGVGGKLDKSDAIASTVSFGYLAYKFNTDTWDLVFHGSIGGLMMGVSLICGVFVSIAALAASSSKKS
jgi:hypothetical protein